jgi:hypothetical protein
MAREVRQRRYGGGGSGRNVSATRHECVSYACRPLWGSSALPDRSRTTVCGAHLERGGACKKTR